MDCRGQGASQGRGLVTNKHAESPRGSERIGAMTAYRSASSRAQRRDPVK